ncbi:hypothetical protein [Oceanobacter sp. 3_MG-2023]|uniref:hypothetical protein n=1 Tax=Oceanobacter sp. 3_MG-2023 TaxID=3062622 RepID=UPI00273541E4|nr:hypothetical protein [Oceanobacter sp. 3_MG-2023]MDP2505379.1 hypothetical protein [Oceanobacter sp. 3_MG-2023]
MATNAFQALEDLQTAINNLNTIIQGGENDSVILDGESVPSVRKSIADAYDEIKAMVEGQLPYRYLADLVLFGEPAVDENGNYPLARVFDDGEDNGLYFYDGSAWVRSDYDPVGDLSLLVDDINARTDGIFDDVDNRTAGLESEELAPESGYVFAITDKTTKRALLAIRKSDGKIIGKFQVDGSSLSESLVEELFANSRAPITVPAHESRSVSVSTGVKTHRSDVAFAWVPFASYETYMISGVDDFSHQFRRRTLRPVANRYVGTWSPGLVQSSGELIRRIDHDDNLPDASDYNAGDYMVFRRRGGGSRDFGGTIGVLQQGDLLVSDGVDWIPQYAPTTDGASQIQAYGSWWRVSAAGWFSCVYYDVDDVILSFGGSYYKEFAKRMPGDWINWGEIDASVGVAPSSPLEESCWQVSSPGTIGGIELELDDWLIYMGGTFGVVKTEPVLTFPSGQPWVLNCYANANEWEARRPEKTGQVYFSAKTPVRLDDQSDYTDSVVLYGDSMTDYIKTDLAAAFGARPFYTADIGASLDDSEGNNSAGSQEILDLMRHDIRTGNRFSGQLHLSWLEQNGEHWETGAYVHAEMRELLTANSKRYVPITVLGRRQMTWDGSRLVCYWQESQFNNDSTGDGADLVLLNHAIREMFGDRYIDCRAELCDRTISTLIDPTYPGMTESEVATTYGVVPLSYYFNYSSVSWSPNDLTYIGTWNDTALPTGGSDLEYYIRTGEGGIDNNTDDVGHIIVNESGTWVEYTTAGSGVVHLSHGDGNAHLSAAIVEKINEWGY